MKLLFPVRFFLPRLIPVMLLLALGISGLHAQREVDLLPFSHLKLLGLIEFELIADTVDRIEINAFGDDADKIKISQQNKTLKISAVNTLIDEDLDIRVKLYYRDLESVQVAGGARLDFRDTVRRQEFYLRAGSGSEVYLNADVEKLEVLAAEGAHFTLSGRATKLRATANTGGILDGHRLRSQFARLRAGTGGEVSAEVTDELSARANTGGVIRYAGEPGTVKSQIFLGGEIDPLLN